MGNHEVVWKLPTMGLWARPGSRWTSCRRRVGRWAGLGGQRGEPRPSFCKHTVVAHRVWSLYDPPHWGGRSLYWQGRGEMGLERAVLWRREAWSLVSSPELMDASSFLICVMRDVSPSLDPRSPLANREMGNLAGPESVSRHPGQPGGFYPLESISSFKSVEASGSRLPPCQKHIISCASLTMGPVFGACRPRKKGGLSKELLM